MPDSPVPPTTKLSLSQEAQAVLDKIGVGSWYTNPLQSMTMRYVLTAAIGLLCSKVFKFEASSIQIQDYVELTLGLVAFGLIAYHRWRSTKQIVSVQEAANMVLPSLEGATARVKADVLAEIKVEHPKVHDIVAEVLRNK